MKIFSSICLVLILCFTTTPSPAQQSMRSSLLRDPMPDEAPPLASDKYSSHASFLSPDDSHWDSRFGMPGVDGEIRAIAATPDYVYVGGEFRMAGSVQVSNIARWSHAMKRWEAIDPLGTDGVVMTIAVQGEKVYIGGQFSRAGTADVNNIAVWNSTTGTWGTLDGGVTGDLYSYVSSIIASGNDLYVGGRFTSVGTLLVNNIARWDGTAWQRVGGGLNRQVYAMTLDGANLYAGGAFTTAGAGSALHVARWDGSSWSAVGDGFDDDVHTLALNKGYLYAGGTFTKSGDSITPMIARWSPSQPEWQSLPGTTRIKDGGSVFAIEPHGDSIFVGGSFTIAAPVDTFVVGTTALAIWKGNDWSVVQAREDDRRFSRTVAGPVYALDASGDEIFIGGNFLPSDIVAWNASSQRMVTFGSSPNAGVHALLTSGKDLYVAGDFTSAGGEWTSKIARWDGSRWHPLGKGVSSGYYQVDEGSLEHIFIEGSILYVGGSLARVGDSASNIYGAARWDGSAWIPMPFNDVVGSWPITGFARVNGLLYAGRYGGNADFTNMLRWDTDHWSQIPGFTFNVNAMVPDGRGNIYLGGNQGIQLWNPTTNTLTPLGTGVSGEVYAINVQGEKVYVGGWFNTAGGIPAHHIAIWNSSTQQWSAIAGGVDRHTPTPHPRVSAIAFAKGRLYVGGLFDVAGDTNSANSVEANNIAVWNGEQWESLGSGVDGAVNTIAVDGDDVYLGGAFKNVGGNIPSWYMAHWNATTSSVREEKAMPQQTLSIATAPNPTSSGTQLHFSVATGGRVHLNVYDMMGREAASLLDTGMTAGEHSLEFDTSLLAPGIYYFRITSGVATATTELVVVR
jgi:hypothetical protein